MLTFAYAWVFVLIPLPVVVHLLVPPQRRSDTAVRVPFLSRLERATGRSASGKTRSAASILAHGCVWLLVVVATARPQLLLEPISRTVPKRDLLLAVDLSGSMEAEDFTDAAGRSVDRLTVVKDVVGEFLTRREGDRVGLIVFGDAPYLQAPFTTDLNLCRQLLDETAVRMAGPKTAFGDAIGLGIQVFENSEVADRVMIALTDGNDTGSGVPPVEAARIARDRGVRIHTVAIGDPVTVGEEQLDLETLRDVADVTDGRAFVALNRDELEGIYAELNTIEARKVETDFVRPKEDLFYWAIGAALLLSLIRHAGTLRLFVSHHSARRPAARLRVNARTFDLETRDAGR